MAVVLFGPHMLVIYFTNWGIAVTIVTTVYLIYYQNDAKINTRSGTLAIIHITSEIATVMNIVVVVIYWPFLHHLAVEYIKINEDNIEPKILYMHLVHIFPAIANVLVL